MSPTTEYMPLGRALWILAGAVGFLLVVLFVIGSTDTPQAQLKRIEDACRRELPLATESRITGCMVAKWSDR